MAGSTNDNSSSSSDDEGSRDFCKYCNIKFACPNAFNRHFRGFAHMQNMQKYKAQKAEWKKEDGTLKSEDTASAGIAEEPKVTPTEEKKESPTEDDDEDFDRKHCTVCEIKFTSDNAYLIHTRGLAHYRKVEELEKLKSEDKFDSNTSTNVTTSKQVYALSPSFAAEERIRLHEVDYDETPEAGYSSIGARSKKPRIDESGDLEIGPTQQQMEAVQQEETVSTVEPATERTAFLEWVREVVKNASDDRTSTPEQPMPKQITRKEWNLARDKDLKPEDFEQTDPVFYCEVCKKVTNSIRSFKDHLIGNKHIRAVQKVRKAAGKEELNWEQLRRLVKFEKKLKVPEAGTRQARPTACSLQSEFDRAVEPLIGLDYMTEYVKQDISLESCFACALCEATMRPEKVLNHVTCYKHMRNYLWANSEKLLRVRDLSKSEDRVAEVRKMALFVESDEGRHTVRLRVEGPDGTWRDVDTGRSRPVPALRAFSKNIMEPIDEPLSNVEVIDYGHSNPNQEDPPPPPPPKKDPTEEDKERFAMAKAQAKEILTSLGECEVLCEDDAEVALQIANALTQALLDYRLLTLSGSFDEKVQTALQGLSAQAQNLEKTHNEQVTIVKSMEAGVKQQETLPAALHTITASYGEDDDDDENNDDNIDEDNVEDDNIDDDGNFEDAVDDNVAPSHDNVGRGSSNNVRDHGIGDKSAPNKATDFHDNTDEIVPSNATSYRGNARPVPSNNAPESHGYVDTRAATDFRGNTRPVPSSNAPDSHGYGDESGPSNTTYYRGNVRPLPLRNAHDFHGYDGQSVPSNASALSVNNDPRASSYVASSRGNMASVAPSYVSSSHGNIESVAPSHATSSHGNIQSIATSHLSNDTYTSIASLPAVSSVYGRDREVPVRSNTYNVIHTASTLTSPSSRPNGMVTSPAPVPSYQAAFPRHVGSVASVHSHTTPTSSNEISHSSYAEASTRSITASSSYEVPYSHSHATIANTVHAASNATDASNSRAHTSFESDVQRRRGLLPTPNATMNSSEYYGNMPVGPSNMSTGLSTYTHVTSSVDRSITSSVEQGAGYDEVWSNQNEFQCNSSLNTNRESAYINTSAREDDRSEHSYEALVEEEERSVASAVGSVSSTGERPDMPAVIIDQAEPNRTLDVHAIASRALATFGNLRVSSHTAQVSFVPSKVSTASAEDVNSVASRTLASYSEVNPYDAPVVPSSGGRIDTSSEHIPFSSSYNNQSVSDYSEPLVSSYTNTSYANQAASSFNIAPASIPSTVAYTTPAGSAANLVDVQSVASRALASLGDLPEDMLLSLAGAVKQVSTLKNTQSPGGRESPYDKIDYNKGRQATQQSLAQGRHLPYTSQASHRESSASLNDPSGAVNRSPYTADVTPPQPDQSPSGSMESGDRSMRQANPSNRHIQQSMAQGNVSRMSNRQSPRDLNPSPRQDTRGSFQGAQPPSGDRPQEPGASFEPIQPEASPYDSPHEPRSRQPFPQQSGHRSRDCSANPPPRKRALLETPRNPPRAQGNKPLGLLSGDILEQMTNIMRNLSTMDVTKLDSEATAQLSEILELVSGYNATLARELPPEVLQSVSLLFNTHQGSPGARDRGGRGRAGSRVGGNGGGRQMQAPSSGGYRGSGRCDVPSPAPGNREHISGSETLGGNDTVGNNTQPCTSGGEFPGSVTTSASGAGALPPQLADLSSQLARYFPAGLLEDALSSLGSLARK